MALPFGLLEVARFVCSVHPENKNLASGKAFLGWAFSGKQNKKNAFL